MAIAPYRYRIVTTNSAPSPGGSVNVVNVGNDVVLTDAQVTNILTALKAFYTSLGTYVLGTFSVGSRVIEYHPGALAPRIVTVAAQGQTNATSSPLPAQCAAVVSWRTALAGRSFRGRTFLGPLNGAANTAGAISGAFITAANTAAATLITAVKAQCSSGWGLVVHSDRLGEDTPITLGNMDSRVDTLRSRG